MMAANKSVIVLAPNGRRQNVKVTSNTTILQILEEACKKHGHNPDEYDLKHYNRILDANAIFRFTGLPNNAQLEMVACTKARQQSNVTIGIQLKSGERIIGEFSPGTSLEQILKDLCPNELTTSSVLIYMHREVYGEALKSTTLKSLGLSSGKAMLRLIHCDPRELKTQAHVYVPPAPKPPRDADISSHTGTAQKSSSTAPELYREKIIDPISLLKAEVSCSKKMKGFDNERETLETTDLSKNVESGIVEKMETETNESPVDTRALQAKRDCAGENNTSCTDVGSSAADLTPEERNVQFLGERNALVFNQSGAQALPRDELPDSFFDLTVQDAKTLLRDVKRQKEQLEETPFLTTAQRQLEQNRRTLNQLHKYRRAVIRIQFQDQMVLQGLFGPLETIETVVNFVKNYLSDPNCEFVLYTAPPKTILKPEARLIDENLVPSAILYYSGSSDLKTELRMKLTNPKAAGIEAIKSRMSMIREDPKMSSEWDTLSNENTAPSTSREARIDQPTAGPSNPIPTARGPSTSSQVPKWFKQPFK